jgi:hypothetical protein
MNFVTDAVKCFGQPYDSEGLTVLLTAMPPHKLDRPSDGSQFAISKEGGFDLQFQDADPEKNHRQTRVLTGLFVFAEGVDKHREFRGPLPFGFAFEDERSTLIRKHAPSRTWVIGKGRVSVDYPNPDSDAWETPEFNLHAQYDEDGRVRWFQIGLPVPLLLENEWRPEPTWQDLALLPDRKKDAIELYRKDASATAADALRAVNAFIAAQKTG